MRTTRHRAASRREPRRSSSVGPNPRATLQLLANGFFERGIANRIEEFGNLVHVWSTYESRHAMTDSAPFARGINSIQIVHAQGRFWLASITWDDERPGLTLPEKYLH